MWKMISLILPALIPSWRFFKAIEPSPRVQWAFVKRHGETVKGWREFRSRPMEVSLLQMVARLFWNPRWNETLFLVSCAERIQQCPTDHSINEIRQRILAEIEQISIGTADKWIQFRLVFVQRSKSGLSENVVYVSDTFPVSGGNRR